MKLRTEIENVPSLQPISCRDGIFVIGSCFADNIGSWLEQSYLKVSANPFGVLYNPASIAKAIAFRNHAQTIIQGADGLFYSFDLHGRFCAQSRDQLVQLIDNVQKNASEAFANAKHVLVTFGTAWVYQREGEIVANCHKFPAKEFTRRRLTVEEIVSMWSELIETSGNSKHFIFTVSPIRHIKDTLHGNQISKSTLLLAIDELCSRFPDRVEYLPVYELLVDDLRDYRFYAEDLVHPSALAVEIVKEYFAHNCLDKECREYLKEVEPLVKAAQHRPLHPESEAYASFKCQNNLKLEQLKKKYSIFGV